MKNKKKELSRREFIKISGVMGAASLGLPSKSHGDDTGSVTPASKLPTRPYGKSGHSVSILGLGGSFDTESNQILLRLALEYGITYWETAERYRNGRSERGYGDYLGKNPKDRGRIFLSTKTMSRRPDEMTAALEKSLERLNTPYIDLYLWHRPYSLEDLFDKAARDWVDKMKSDGRIRLFGFSTHMNMEDQMMSAVRLGGIDGIQFSYNFRHMHTEKMISAIEACTNAGIGLTAMKTVGTDSFDRFQGAPEISESEMALLSKMTGQYLRKGFTDIQARLIAVWQNPQIASICSYMPNTTILKANVDAGMQWDRFSRYDMELLEQYSRETSSGYCLGCTSICQPAVGGHVPIGDIMRYLMYYHNYGEYDRARSLFNKLPAKTRKKIAIVDYALAEQHCPQKMAIGRLMAEAEKLLA